MMTTAAAIADGVLSERVPAIVAGVAEVHGGTPDVESSPGHGSRFRLRLPLPVPETPGRID